MGHVLALKGRYPEALDCYRFALEPVPGTREGQRRGHHAERRTADADLPGPIRPKLLAWAGEARVVFTKQGDRLRLARLDSNLGNMLYRQGRFEEALALYRRATCRIPQTRRAAGRGHHAPQHGRLPHQPECVSRGVAHLSKGARVLLCASLALLVGEADYNIAYLHYLRGEYTRAIELYRAARSHCETLGDPYHQALCDLDQSELYLELNLIQEGGATGRPGAGAGSRSWGWRIETGKALANLASAASQPGAGVGCAGLLAQARQRFRRERSPIWLALINLNEALVLFRLRRYCAGATPVSRGVCRLSGIRPSEQERRRASCCSRVSTSRQASRAPPSGPLPLCPRAAGTERGAGLEPAGALCPGSGARGARTTRCGVRHVPAGGRMPRKPPRPSCTATSSRWRS